MGEEIIVSEQAGAVQVQQQVNQIQYLMQQVLKEGEHYGTIPGCGDKPTLLQPGAEKIAMMFNLVPTYEFERIDLGNCHREYMVTCTLVSRDTGQIMGMGVGSCSTAESKYRYRNVSGFEVLDDPIPQDARENKQAYRKKGFGMKKINGEWVWVKYTDSERQENPDIADTWNTVLKIAKKRSFIDAVKSTTAASDIFTQDIEDMGAYVQPKVDQRKELWSVEDIGAYVQPKVDPRKALWSEVATLKEAVLDGGTSEDGITSWMGAHIVFDDGTSKPANHYTAEDIKRLKAYLESILESQRELANDPVVELLDEEIEF